MNHNQLNHNSNKTVKTTQCHTAGTTCDAEIQLKSILVLTVSSSVISGHDAYLLANLVNESELIGPENHFKYSNFHLPRPLHYKSDPSN